MSPADIFHAHLDVCQRCREHPFDLCQTGFDFLVATSARPDDDDPEGRVVAQVGAIHLSPNGRLYVKESGAGASGWVRKRISPDLSQPR